MMSAIRVSTVRLRSLGAQREQFAQVGCPLQHWKVLPTREGHGRAYSAGALLCRMLVRDLLANGERAMRSAAAAEACTP